MISTVGGLLGHAITSSLLLLPLNHLGDIIHGTQTGTHNENHILGIDFGQRVRPKWVHLAHIAVLERLQIHDQVDLARYGVVPYDYLRSD